MEVVDAYKKFGVLYVTQFEWGAVIWRPLSWSEVDLYEKLFMAAPGAKAELEEQIFRDCVVEHPLPEEDFDNWQAGIITTVANQIVKVSSATHPEEFIGRLNRVREEVAGNVLYQIYASIMKVFPYKMEELIAMPLETLLERLAMAEVILGDKLPIQIEKAPPSPIGPIDFEAENRKLRELESSPPAGDWNLNRRRGTVQ